MAAFTGTPTGTTLYNRQVGTTQGKPSARDAWGKLNMAAFSYTHAAGAGTGEVNLALLPAGHITINAILSRVITTAYAANADLHLGYRSYTEPDGDVIAADDNAFLDNADAGGGALDSTWLLPATDYLTEINSAGLLTIYGMVDTGNIEDTDTLNGWVVWAGIQ